MNIKLNYKGMGEASFIICLNSGNNVKLAGLWRGTPEPKLRFMVGEDNKNNSVELEATLA